MNPVRLNDFNLVAQDSLREILFRTICILNTGECEGGFFVFGSKNKQGEESHCHSMEVKSIGDRYRDHCDLIRQLNYQLES